MIKKEKLNIKFYPPIKSRFLPGEIESNLDELDFQNYKSHRLHCVNVQPVIDNKPPKFDIDVYYDRQKLNKDAHVAMMNYRINLDLAKKINTIFRIGGKTDCWNFKDKKHKIDQYEKKEECKRIMRENRALFKKLNEITSEYSPEILAKQWRILKEQIEFRSKYPWFKEISSYSSISENATNISSDKNIQRPKCFFDLELAHSKLPLGRIVFELYTDFVPLTCANFEAFCKGFEGLSYKGTPFHRILSGYWCQGGDVRKFNGVGGASIYDDVLPDENFSLQHNCPGVLSTYNDDKNVCDSKFNLSFRPLRTMDGKKIVFGKVVKGLQNLFKIEAYGTKFGKPLQKIIISNCGILQSPKSKRLVVNKVNHMPSKRV